MRRRSSSVKPPPGLVEVVVKAVLDGGADGDLRAGEEPLHRVGHHVGRGVADDREALGIGGPDGRERVHVHVHGRVQIDRAAADLDGDDVLVELAGGCEQLARGLSFGHGGAACIAQMGRGCPRPGSAPVGDGAAAPTCSPAGRCFRSACRWRAACRRSRPTGRRCTAGPRGCRGRSARAGCRPRTGSPMSRLPTSQVTPLPDPLQVPAPRQACIARQVPPLQVSSVLWSAEQPRVSVPARQGAPAAGGPKPIAWVVVAEADASAAASVTGSVEAEAEGAASPPASLPAAGCLQARKSGRGSASNARYRCLRMRRTGAPERRSGQHSSRARPDAATG